MSITAPAVLGMRMAKTLQCDFTLLQMQLSAVVMGKYRAQSCQLQELPVCARIETNATVSTYHSAAFTQTSSQPPIF